MDAIETIEYKGHKIHVYPDIEPESPREWDNLGLMVCFHPRYILGDKHKYTTREARLIAEDPDFISLPLYLYDHSIQSISTRSFTGRAHHAEWDSGQVGWIFVQKSRALEELSRKRLTQGAREHILRILQGEVETYDQWLRGEVYGYHVVDEHGDVVDSCWGFYGSDHDYMISQAKSYVDYAERERLVNLFKEYLGF